MGLTERLLFRRPGVSRIRHCLVGTRFVLTPDLKTQFFTYRIRLLDCFFLASASAFMTVTRPALRTRCTSPVRHQVRSACQLYPASCSTRPMVSVLTSGKPSGASRSARCKLVSDPWWFVPSVSARGGRVASASMRPYSASVYL